MLIWTSEAIKDGFTPTFTATSQPFFIVLRGRFAPVDGRFGYGTAQVQFQASNGDWVDCTDLIYRRPMQDIFRLPPGGVGRVSIRGCGGVVVEIHDSSPLPTEAAA